MKKEIIAAQEQAVVVNQLQDEVERLKELVRTKEKIIVNGSQEEFDGTKNVMVGESQLLDEAVRLEVDRLRAGVEEKAVELQVALTEKESVSQQLVLVSSELEAFKQLALDEKDDLVTLLEHRNADLLKKEQELGAKLAECTKLEADCLATKDTLKATVSRLEKLENERELLRVEVNNLSKKTADLASDKESLETIVQKQQLAQLEMKGQMEKERVNEVRLLREEIGKVENLYNLQMKETEMLQNELITTQQQFACQQSEIQAEWDAQKSQWDEEKKAMVADISKLQDKSCDMYTQHEVAMSELRCQGNEEQETKAKQLLDLQAQLQDVTGKLHCAEVAKEEMICQWEKERASLVRQVEKEDSQTSNDALDLQLQGPTSHIQMTVLERETLSDHYKPLLDSLEDEKAKLEREKNDLSLQLQRKEEEMKESLSELTEKYEGRINKLKLQAKARITAMHKKKQQQKKQQQELEVTTSFDTSLQPVSSDKVEQKDWEAKLQSRVQELGEMQAMVEKEKMQERGTSDAVDEPVILIGVGVDCAREEVRGDVNYQQTEYTRLAESYHKLKEEHSGLFESHNLLLKRHAQMVTDYKQLESELDSSKTHASEVERKADDVQEDAKCQEEQLEALRNELLSKNDTIQNLEKRLHETEIEVSAFQYKVDETDINFTQVRNEKDLLVEKLELLEREQKLMVEEEQERRRCLESNVQEMTGKLDEARSTIKFQAMEIEVLQQERNQLKADISKLEPKVNEETRLRLTQVSDLTKEKEALLEEVRQKDTQLTEERDAFRKNQEEMERVRLEFVKGANKEQEAEARVMQLEDERQLLEQEKADGLKKLSAVETEYQSQLKILLDEKIQEEDELKAVIEQLQKERDIHADKLSQVLHLNTALEEDRNGLLGELTARKQSCANLESRVSELNEELKAVREAVETKDCDLVDLRQQLQTQLHEVTSLTSMLTNMSEQHRQLQEELQQTSNECQKHEGIATMLHHQVSEVNIARETLETQKSELTRSIQLKVSEVLQIDDEKNKVSGELALCVANLEVSQRNEERLAKELASIRDERNRLEQDFSASLQLLQSQLSDSSSQLEVLKRQVVTKQQAVEDVERQWKIEKHECQEVKKELEKTRDAYCNHVDEDEVRTREMQARISMLEDELADMQSQVRQVIAEREEVAVQQTKNSTDLKHQTIVIEEKDRYKKETETLMLQLQSVQQQVEDSEIDKEHISGRLQQLENENMKLYRTKGELEESLRVEHQKLVEVQDALTQMQRSTTSNTTKSTAEVCLAIDSSTSDRKSKGSVIDWLRRWFIRSLGVAVGMPSRPRLAAAVGYAVFIHLLLFYLLIL
ncbi:uncharacterized protein LOC134186996 isoform X2 [Corticium candelabrum]|nr:uncharacterized protein LOC134186996 isoform X2 [Corticium candelabrum]XP_062511089.1 uncharacterized protein LOC134186996 isoform X2 [Corticium candelabrum]